MSSPEFDLIRLAARADLDARRAGALREAAGAALDWPRVLRLASYHRLTPLLSAHLGSHAASAVPADALAALRDETQRMAVYVLVLSSEMARVAERLEAHGLAYLVLKGPSLTAAYGGVAKRPFVDNDLLIRRHDFGRVAQALRELGFDGETRDGLRQRGHRLVHGESTFCRAVGTFPSTVDLHTGLVPLGFSYAPRFEDLRGRSRPIEVAGATVPALSWEDLFLTLSVNALKDQWDHLRLAADVAEVGARVQDWEAVTERAARLGSLRAVHLAVLVAAAEVSATFPEPVLRRARQDRRARALARTVRSSLATAAEAPVMPGPARVRLNLLVQDGPAGQARYAAFVTARRMLERWVGSEP